MAEEIRILAENVDEATKEIKEIVLDIQDSTKSAVIAIEDETKKIKTGSGLVQRAKEMFEDIDRITQESTSASQQISESIQQNNMNTQDAFETVKEISQGIIINVNEHKRITDSLTRLFKISSTLNSAMAQFKVHDSFGHNVLSTEEAQAFSDE